MTHEQIATDVAFVASDEASFMTGAEVYVDGHLQADSHLEGCGGFHFFHNDL